MVIITTKLNTCIQNAPYYCVNGEFDVSLHNGPRQQRGPTDLNPIQSLKRNLITN